MALVLAFLVLCTTATAVRSDCSSAYRNFREQISGPGDLGGDKICLGGGTCCKRQDVGKLDKLTREKMSIYLRQALTYSLVAMRKSASTLDAAVCHKLKETSTQSDTLLAATYTDYYTRNRELFLDLFCNLTTMYQSCDMCYSRTEDIAKGFLRRLLIVLLKENSNARYITNSYEQCIVRSANLETTFGTSMITWLIARLQKGLCRTCYFRQALTQAADLLHAAKRPRIASNPTCEAKLRCMHSCSCCRGSSQCGLTPCRDCCMDSLTPCIEPDFTALHPTFSGVVDHLQHEANEMLEPSSDPDYLLKSLTVTMSEAVMNAYLKIETLTETIRNECGNIRANLLQSQPSPPAVRCPACMGSVKTVHVAMTRVRADLPLIRNIFRDLKLRICSVQSTSPGIVDGCDSCSQCMNMTGTPEQRPSPYLSSLKRMERNLPASYLKALKDRPNTVDKQPENITPHPSWSYTAAPDHGEEEGGEQNPEEEGSTSNGCLNSDDEDCQPRGSGSGSGSGQAPDDQLRDAPWQPVTERPTEVVRTNPPTKSHPRTTQGEILEPTDKGGVNEEQNSSASTIHHSVGAFVLLLLLQALVR